MTDPVVERLKPPPRRYIAHRANLHGPNLGVENNPDAILGAMGAGFDVEVDVRLVDGKLMLGHDYAHDRWPTGLSPLDERLWLHAKDIETLYYLLDLGAQCFFHEHDPATLTSTGWIWTYPGQPLTFWSVCVMPERVGELREQKWVGAGAVCSDWIADIREMSGTRHGR